MKKLNSNLTVLDLLVSGLSPVHKDSSRIVDDILPLPLGFSPTLAGASRVYNFYLHSTSSTSFHAGEQGRTLPLLFKLFSRQNYSYQKPQSTWQKRTTMSKTYSRPW